MSTLGYDPQRVAVLAERTQRVAEHVASGRCDDPLAADAVAVARSVAAHVNDGWFPALAAVQSCRALLDPVGGHLVADIVDGFSQRERTYFQGYVDAYATSVAQQLWLYDAEPNYDTARLPANLETLDSPSEWGWLAQLYLVEEYHRMVVAGDVELQRDGDAYWVDPLDLQDTGSLITADIVLAAVMSSGGFRPGSGFSAASAATHVAPMPEPRPLEPIRLTTEESWGNLKTLDRHFVDHGADFAAVSADDYARLASEFFQQPGTRTKIDSDGVIRIWDATTNTFGSYSASGTTRTFYRPDPAVHGRPTNRDYWKAQRGWER